MAYNKSKGKQKHGDVIYDKDTDTQIDFEQNEIKFRTGGSVRGSFTNGGLSVTGSLTGMTTVSASLGVSGSSAHFDEHVVSGHLSGTLIHGGTVNVGQGVFTVSNEGAVVGASLDNSNGGITNAGSIAGATTIDGSGDLTMGTITMTGFTVDADGDTNVKSLTSEGIVSGTTATVNRLTTAEIGTDTDTAQIKLTNNQILIDGAVLTSSLNTDRASFGGSLTSSQGRFHIDGNGAIYASSGSFTVASNGVVSASGGASFGGTLAAANSGFTVDADGDTNVKSLTSVGIVSGTTATVNKIEVSEFTNGTAGGDIILQTRLTSSNQGYNVQFAGGLTSSQGTFAISSEGGLSSSGPTNHFLGTLEAAGERFSVDDDSDTSVKSLVSEGVVTAGTTVSGSTVTADSARFHTIGSDALATHITLDIDGVKFARGLSGSSSGYGFDWPGSASFGQGMATVSSVGNIAAPIVSGTTTQANRLTVNEIGTDTDVSQITLTPAAIAINENITGSSAGHTFHWAGEASFDEGTVTITNDGVISGSKNIDILGTLKTAGERFSVDADGDTSVKSLTSEGVISGSSVTSDSARFYQIGVGADPDLLVLTDVGSPNQLTVNGAISASHHITASHGFFEDYVYSAVGSFGSLNLGGQALSSSAVTAHAVTASFIGSQLKPSLIKMEQNLITINGSAISASATIAQYFDYAGPVRFAGNQVRFTHQGTGSIEGALFVTGNVNALSMVNVGGGLTSSANRFFVDGLSGNLFTSGTISGSSHLDVGGDIRARNGSLTMAGTLNLGGGNIINASGVSGSGNVTFGGKLEMLGKQFKIDNQADLSSSGDIEIYGKLEVGGENFIVQQDGDLSGSGYAYFAGKLEAAARGFRVDSDGDTIVKSLSSSLAVTAQNFAADGAVVVGGNISGAVLSGSAAATLHSLNVGQNLTTISNEGIISTSRAISGSGGLHITGTYPVIAIGATSDGTGPQDAMLNVRPTDTSNRVLALFQSTEADGMRTCLGVTGSGKVLVGGLYLDGVLNVSGATAETLLAVKSDTVAQALKVQGDGKVGIGTSAPLHTLAVTASSGISLSGSTEISGTLTINDSLRAKQLHMTSHKFTPGNTTAHFVRFDTNGGDTTQTDNNKLTAPYSGKLIKVAARATNAAGSTVISLHTNVDGNQNVNGTATEAITVNMAAANTTYTFTFTDTANYGPGDIVGIKFNPTNDPGTPTLTAVWEFDHNS